MSANPFAALDLDNDDDDSSPQVAASSSSSGGDAPAASKPKSNKPKRDNAGRSSDGNTGGSTYYEQEHNDVRGPKAGRGGKGGRGDRATGRGRGRGDGREPRGERHRSQGKAGNKPDEKREGHGAGNWGTKTDAVKDGLQELADSNQDDPRSPTGDDADEGDEPEVDNEISFEDYMKQKNSAKGKSSLKIRVAGEDESKPGYKVADNIVTRVEENAITYSGKDAKVSKMREGRKGRAVKTEQVVVDIKYGASEGGMGGDDRDDRGGDRRAGGRGRGGGRGYGRGEGRGEGRGRGRTDRGRGRGRGGRGGRGGDSRGPRTGGRGGSRGSGGPAIAMDENNFPSL